jgi:hypothetical protein
MTCSPKYTRRVVFSANRAVLAACLSAALATSGFAGPVDLAKQGPQFAVAGAAAGEQTGARLALGPNGGFLAWQDNAIDGNGLGISGILLSGNGEPLSNPIGVNLEVDGDQDSPEVARLSTGGHIIVWRNGSGGKSEIRGRIFASNGTRIGSEFSISAPGSICQNPVVAALGDGSCVVAWSQRESRGVMSDVYYQKLDAVGARIGGAALANHYTSLNQRTPAIATLRNGDFALAWVSEEQSASDSVDIIGRVFQPDGTARGAEFRVNQGLNSCANPALIGLSNGGILFAWSDLDLESLATNWDVKIRAYSSNLEPSSTPSSINSQTKGRQYRPKLTQLAAGAMVTWTSFGQDGWDEGVFTRPVNESAAPVGDELQVNTEWEGRQFEPTVASAGGNSALVIWSGYNSGSSSINLAAQRIAPAPTGLPPMQSPTVYSTSPNRLHATWSRPAGLDVAKYEVFLDEATTPEVTSNVYWSSKALLPASRHQVTVAYVLADGRKGPASEIAEGLTWAEDANGDGLPDDWQTLYFGSDGSNWPSPLIDSDADGASDRMEFLAGTNPLSNRSRFQLEVRGTEQGTQLAWSTQAGNLYQVQLSPDLKNWLDHGSPRVAGANEDSIDIQGAAALGFYRVIRVR